MLFNKISKQFINTKSYISRAAFILCVIFFLFQVKLDAQQNNLFPDATWLQDVHFPGTVYAGVPAPLMPSVQAHLDGLEYMFHLKSDVDKASPLIAALHAQGKKYWVNLDGGVIEGTSLDSIINDGQGITDPNFGAFHTLEGNLIYLGESVKRNINRPAWRNYLISCIKRAIDAGAEGSQHDFGATVTNNSFDDEEVSEFEQYVQDNAISTGDWNSSTMNFREYLISIGKNDNNVFDNDSDPQNLKDLINHWYDFKSVNTLNSWQMVKDSCRDYAESKGQDYTIALNAGSALGTRFGHTYFVSDYAIGEFFGWGNLFPFNGTLSAKSKIFEALGKRFICWSGPTLEDIPLANPYDSYPPDIHKEAEMHLVSTLYASGGLPQLKYPAEDTYPAYLLAQANREILNSVTTADDIGVVMSHAQTLEDVRGLEGLVAVLQDLNRGFKVIFFKSNRLNISDDITQNDLSKFKVIFLPEVFYLTDNQRTQLLTFISNGGTVVSVRGNVEYSGWVDENGNNQTNSTWASLADENNSTIKTYGQGKFINIAHNIMEGSYPLVSYGFDYSRFKYSLNSEEAAMANSIKDTIGYWINQALPKVDVFAENLPPHLRVFKYQDTLSHHYVYHLLSDSVQIPSRSPIPVSPFTIELSVAQSSYNKAMRATFYTIDNPYGIQLSDGIVVNQETGRVSINIPEFSRWGFIDLTESYELSNVKVDSLLINGSATPYRLKSNSEIMATWDAENNPSGKYQIEVWTNLEGLGDPVINFSQNQMSLSKNLIDSKLQSAQKVYAKTFSSTTGTYVIPSNELSDSTVYFIRLRAIEASDTSQWIQQFFYRNGRPAAPIIPKIYTSHQNLWYFWNGVTHLSPPDTSSKLIFSFEKGCDNKGCYGGDFELDTLLYGAVFYTDSLTGRNGNDSSALYKIGSQDLAKLAFNEGDGLTDTIKFSLDEYENFGIYFRPFASDFIDTSDLGNIFGFYLDQRNDPPNEFNLISPRNNSFTQDQIPFSWKNNGDPDPFSKTNYSISKVELQFDSVATFDSPGLRTYERDRQGLEFEMDTITVNLPSNFFQFEGLLDFKNVYWKAIMYDFDRDAAEGGGDGILSRESSETFVLNIGVPTIPDVPILLEPQNNVVINIDSVNFKWEKSISPVDKYWFEYSTDSSFSNSVIDSNLIETTKSVVQLLENDKYWWRVRAKNEIGWGAFSQIFTFSKLITTIDEEIIPEEYSLKQNYPNPFNPSTKIGFSLPKSSHVNLSIYNLLGQKVREVLNEFMNAGNYEQNINLKEFTSGIYVYTVKAEEYSETKKMILLK